MAETPPTCRIHEKYEDIECTNPALTGDADGFCILHSCDKDKDQVAFVNKIKDKLAKEDYDFHRVFFHNPVSFMEYEFNKDAIFSGAIFAAGGDFRQATFFGHADFFAVDFPNKASRADFSGAKFSRGYNFSGANFSGGAHFVGTKFCQGTHFITGLGFSGETSFQGARFDIEANFPGATFSGRADFTSSTFSGSADFQNSIFSLGATFSAAEFSQKCNFTSITIPDNKVVYFRGTDFSDKQEVIFRAAKIYGTLIFEQINLPDSKKKKRSWYGDFIRLDIGSKAILRFRDVSLALVRFESTDLKKIEFEDVEWYKFLSRQAVYEEIALGKNLSSSKYALIEKIYRELKINYKNQEDYKIVGDFHYGEMEMHRKASFWRRRIPFSWYNLYWALSGYGERPSRALGWLAGFLLALPLLVWGVGLDRVTGGTTPGFLETFTYIFEKATFQRPPLLANLNLWGRFISNLSLLIIPGQAALFLLALRNRLGRRR